MSLIFILLLGLSLGVDSFCALLAIGSTEKNTHRRKVFIVLALTIGIFHFIMPLIGWYFSTFLIGYIESYAKYIACILFAFLGIKMIKESFLTEPPKVNITIFRSIVLSIALSIDALVAGFSLSLIDTSYSIFLIASIFAILSFLMTIFGYIFGAKYCCFNTKLSYIIGGLILIGLGVKELF